MGSNRELLSARRLWVALFLSIACLGLSSARPAISVAAESPPELLWQTPEDELTGAAAGRMFGPRGVATSSTTGDVFVVDGENGRITVFDVWGEFIRTWGYGVQDGTEVLQVCTSGCRKGNRGSAAGQLDNPQGIAVDSNDAVYVYDAANLRVVKYDSEGHLLLSFGGAGTAPGEFSNGSGGNYIAVGPANTIFVGDKDRIQEFEPDGTFKGQITFTGELAALAGTSVRELAIDPLSGDLYISVTGDEIVYRISAAGELRGTVEDSVEVDGNTETFPIISTSLAVDSEGNLYVVNQPEPDRGPFEILKFSPVGECLICGQDFAQPDDLSVQSVRLNGLAFGSACGINGDDLYVTEYSDTGLRKVSYVRAYGPPPEDVINCPPPQRPPGIDAQYAKAVGSGDALVQARINPRFFVDTTYYVQFGSEECFASDWQQGCSTVPVPPGTTLTDKVLNRSISTGEIALENLLPNTTYHYRFVAQSNGGGPVFGVGGTENTEGASSTFHTFPPPLPRRTDCPNQMFRTGASAPLPDCRAFEMVSPIDKNGGDIDTQKSIRGYAAALDLAGANGESVTFSSSTAFADASSSPFVSQYKAVRHSDGWSTESISAPRDKPIFPIGSIVELDLQYKLFSPELDEAWLMQEADPPLDGCGVPGFVNLYRRDNSTGTYEAITTNSPPQREPDEYFAEVQGASSDGAKTIFRANDRLTPDAAAGTNYQVYEHVSEAGGCGQLRLVSILPDGTPNPTASSVGSAAAGTNAYTFVEGRENLVDNAVSADGSRVYWTAAGSGEGRIYLRLNGTETIPVSSSVALFWAAADDVSAAYFIQKGNLFRFTLATKKATLVATGVTGLLGTNEEASRAYLVSEEDLAGAAVAGEPNVYLAQGTKLTYVTTLSATDVNPNSAFTPNNAIPALRSSRVSDDANYLVFTSDRSLTGYDNFDAESGLPDTEVYLYEAEASALSCISCNSTGARPAGRVIAGANRNQVGLASRIPPWKNQFHSARVLSEDGSRLYFETFEILTPGDRDKSLDVYQWARAENATQCEEIGAESFDANAGGCLSLLSSGDDSDDAELVDSTADASSVFIKTNASLLPQDPGRIDIYAVRVGGGFPRPGICDNPDGCPPPPPVIGPPPPPSPGSQGGSGNPNFRPCERLDRKAAALRAKARKLRAKARKKAPAESRKLKVKAKKDIKKAKRLSARAKKCSAGAGGR
jgi:hypothetical protein